MAFTAQPFRTPIHAKLALSAAFSNQFNPRGLETNYCPVWMTTLADACAFSNRLSVATEPYLSVPGHVMNKMKITKRTAAPDGGRVSGRLTKKKEKIILKFTEEDQPILASLKHVKSESQGSNTFNFEADLSKDLGFVPDADAQDNRADISVTHTIGGTFRGPTFEEIMEKHPNKSPARLKLLFNNAHAKHYARAGIKAVHRCTILIGEFKRAPPANSFNDVPVDVSTIEGGMDEEEDDLLANQWVLDREKALRVAMEDLMYYCGVHFLLQPSASKVIAVASSGPFWVWALITRPQVPTFDWVTKSPLFEEYNLKLAKDFPLGFSTTAFILGTKESDEEIEMMRHVMKTLMVEAHPNDGDWNVSAALIDLGFNIIPDAPVENRGQ